MEALPSTLRPRLREDVRFVPSPDGVYLHGDHGTCMLRGRHAYDWVSRLAPALDGNRTLAELTAALPDDKRSMVDRLLQDLIAHRMVVDDLTPSPHELTEVELSIYPQEIAFIGYTLDSPEQRFQRVRESRTVLIGAGPGLAPLVAALTGSGWRDLTVVTEQEPEVADALARARRDPTQQVRVAAPGSDSAAPDGADLVIQLASDPAELIDLCHRHRNSTAALAQLLLRPDEAWLGPVGSPGDTGAESGWRRLAPHPARGPARGRPGPDPHGAEDYLTGPVPEVLAAMMTLACFSHLTGLDQLDGPGAPESATLTRVDLRNLDTRAHRFLQHPAVAPPPVAPGGPTGADAVRTTVAALAAREALTAEELLGHAEWLVDPHLGVVPTLDEGSMAQVPMAVCRATVRAPDASPPAWAPLPAVVSWGEDRRTARLRALLGATAGYASLAARSASLPVWGIELPDGQARTVTLAPTGSAPVGQPELPAGLGAGLSWQQAVAAGLRTHCEEVLSRSGGPDDCPTVPLPDVHLARLVQATQEPVEVRDLTGVLGVPAFWFLLAGQPSVVSAAATVETAMRDGLERLLLRWQSRTRRQATYRQVRPYWYDPDPAAEPAGDPYGVRLLAGALRRYGQIPVAVPLHADPEVARLVPYLAEVALVHD